MELGELFENAITHWRNNKGVGTALIPSIFNDKVMLLGVLQRIYARSPTVETLIMTNTFQERSDIIEFLTNQENEEENNNEFKELIKNHSIKIYTYSYVEKLNFNHYPLLCVLYHLDSLSDNVTRCFQHCKFKLVILNNLIVNTKDRSMIYKHAPLLEDFKQNEIEAIRMSTPVEEEWIGVTVDKDSEDYKLLEFYNEYITTSITIFGSLDIMQQANKGNSKLNISANQICQQIALENGWNDHLDMSIDFNVEIDRLYNPMNLRERAVQTYEYFRNRSKVLSDYKGKLDKILDIVKTNKDKKILIINKRGEFASKVTDYINNMSETNICMNYHDKVDDIPAVDLDGNPIYYKSGAKKGQRRLMGYQMQKTYAINKFNKGDINVLSTSNAPDKDLNISVDIIIITSPLCEDIQTYLYRLSNIYFSQNKVKLFSLFCSSTMEQKVLEKKPIAPNHSVKNIAEYENFSDFVIVD